MHGVSGEMSHLLIFVTWSPVTTAHALT